MIKHVEFIILGAVVLVAVIGLFTTLQDVDNDFDTGGRGRKFVEDTASIIDFNPVTNYELRARKNAFKGDVGVIWGVNQAVDEDTFQTKRSKRYFKGDAGVIWEVNQAVDEDTFQTKRSKKAFRGDAGVIWEVNQAVDEDTFQTKRRKRYFKGDAG